MARDRFRGDEEQQRPFPIGSYFWGVVIRLAVVALMVFFVLMILNPGVCMRPAVRQTTHSGS